MPCDTPVSRRIYNHLTALCGVSYLCRLLQQEVLLVWHCGLPSPAPSNSPRLSANHERFPSSINERISIDDGRCPDSDEPHRFLSHGRCHGAVYQAQTLSIFAQLPHRLAGQAKPQL